MPKLKNYKKGQRVNIWIPARLMETWLEIENHSKFVQIAADQAVGVMTWGLMKEKAPDIYSEPNADKLVEVAAEFNKKFPLDPLTKKRMENKDGSRIEARNAGDHTEPNPALR